MAINVSKYKLDSFYLNLLLIHDTYINNEEFVNKKTNKFIEKYNQNYNKQNDIDYNLSNYVKLSVSYSLLQTGITQMYHLFEQFIKIYFNVNLEKDYKETNIIASTYNYDIKQNENFELVNKYRLINNAIKHGSIKELSKYYPDLINDIHSDNDYGTILDDKLNITESELDECFICLFKFVVEMNAYFEDMGYKE